ncbi:hypothetical protein NMY22_g9106 [Coprinellus aureogranulatus]|nr:hypothetical protein NMY22_g9106 [Coprinellus aureogranulatus]
MSPTSFRVKGTRESIRRPRSRGGNQIPSPSNPRRPGRGSVIQTRSSAGNVALIPLTTSNTLSTMPLRSSSPSSSTSRAYHLRSTSQQVSTIETDTQLRALADTSVKIESAGFKLGCTVVRALDQVQDIVALHQKRTGIMSEITSAHGGFPDDCCVAYKRLYEEKSGNTPSTPIESNESGSIVNFSREELITLGNSFSTRPGSLQLDRTVERYWGTSGEGSARSGAARNGGSFEILRPITGAKGTHPHTFE